MFNYSETANKHRKGALHGQYGLQRHKTLKDTHQNVNVYVFIRKSLVPLLSIATLEKDMTAEEIRGERALGRKRKKTVEVKDKVGSETQSGDRLNCTGA